jgi:peptide/nickel transport system permease protein
MPDSITLQPQASTSPLRKILQMLRAKRVGRLVLNPGLSLLILGAIVVLAAFSPLIAPYDPYKGDLYKQFQPPSWMEGGNSQHVLGTDYFGRDILSRLIYGARITFLVAFLAIILSSLLGAVLGLIAAYCGGIVDAILMRIVDALISIPFLVIAIVLSVALGSGLINLVLILTLFQWPFYARQIRAEALVIRETDYVALAKIAGASPVRIIFKHFFVNIIPTLLVLATFQIGDVIMWEAMLSFLGIGTPPPMPSWGLMVSEGKDYIITRWWLSAFPGFAILLTVLAANIFGDWIRDYLDPRLRQL